MEEDQIGNLRLGDTLENERLEFVRPKTGKVLLCWRPVAAVFFELDVEITEVEQVFGDFLEAIAHGA